jgi:hypothetical protein
MLQQSFPVVVLGGAVALFAPLSSGDQLPRAVTESRAVLIGERESALPVAPMPREPKKYWGGTSEYIQGVVVRCFDGTLTIRCNLGILREFKEGIWLGTKYPAHGSKYRFDQVHVGDQIAVGFEVVEGLSVAQNLCINRRPGGTIPVEPWTPDDAHWPWHLAAQLRQDAEEKGLPLPRTPSFGECPWVVNGEVVPTRKIIDYLFEKERREVARVVAEHLVSGKSLFDLPPRNRQPGTINGVAIPAEVLRKAIAEQEGRPYVPLSSPPKVKQ